MFQYHGSGVAGEEILVPEVGVAAIRCQVLSAVEPTQAYSLFEALALRNWDAFFPPVEYLKKYIKKQLANVTPGYDFAIYLLCFVACLLFSAGSIGSFIRYSASKTDVDSEKIRIFTNACYFLGSAVTAFAASVVAYFKSRKIEKIVVKKIKEEKDDYIKFKQSLIEEHRLTVEFFAIVERIGKLGLVSSDASGLINMLLTARFYKITDVIVRGLREHILQTAVPELIDGFYDLIENDQNSRQIMIRAIVAVAINKNRLGTSPLLCEHKISKGKVSVVINNALKKYRRADSARALAPYNINYHMLVQAMMIKIKAQYRREMDSHVRRCVFCSVPSISAPLAPPPPPLYYSPDAGCLASLRP